MGVDLVLSVARLLLFFIHAAAHGPPPFPLTFVRLFESAMRIPHSLTRPLHPGSLRWVPASSYCPTYLCVARLLLCFSDLPPLIDN